MMQAQVWRQLYFQMHANKMIQPPENGPRIHVSYGICIRQLYVNGMQTEVTSGKWPQKLLTDHETVVSLKYRGRNSETNGVNDIPNSLHMA